MSYDNSNIFARIIRGVIPSDTVYEDEKVIAFNDISPAAPVHVLVLPKGEYVSFDDFAAHAPAQDIAHFYAAIQKIAADKGLQKSGYRLICNHGPDASQTVPHFHVHILGGAALGGLLASDKLTR